MSSILNQPKRIFEAEERATDLSQDGKKANKEISQLGFSLIKDMINTGDELNHTDVNNYLDKADSINDEVDTVIFGLETDDGEIVKVYVAVTDADAFEQAMSEKLGTEDDIESVIAELAQEYDIVDVEWPDNHEEESDTESEDEEDESETQNSKDGESKEAEAELNFDEPVIAKEHMEDHMTTFGERFKQRVTSINESKKEEKQWPKEIEGFAKTLTNPAQEAILYLITQFNLPSEILGSKKAIGEFRRNIIRVAQEYSKNQTLKMYINKLTREMSSKSEKEDADDKSIKEAKADKESEKETEEVNPDWDDPKLAKASKFRDTLPRGVPRLLFDVLIALGVPETMLVDLNKAKVKNTLRTLSMRVKKTQRIRIYFNLIADAFGVTKDDQSETASRTPKKVEEAMDDISAGSNPVDEYIILIKQVLLKLGIPEANLNYRSSKVIQSIKNEKRNLNFSVLIPKLEAFLEWIAKAERGTSEVTEATAADYDMYVKQLAVLLGVPQENLDYREQGVIQSLRQRKSTLNWATVVTKLKKLVGYVESLERKQKSITEVAIDRLKEQQRLAEAARAKKKVDEFESDPDMDQDDDVSKILSKSSKTPAKNKDDGSIDVGRWNFASLGSAGFKMSARGVKLQFEDIVAERIAKAFGDSKPATVKNVNGERIVFSPRDRGTSYVIAGIEGFENGVKMNSKDIDNLLDALGGK